MHGFDTTIRLATLRQEDLLRTAGLRTRRSGGRDSGLGRWSRRSRRGSFPGRAV
jgi:hypothetical protein